MNKSARSFLCSMAHFLFPPYKSGPGTAPVLFDLSLVPLNTFFQKSVTIVSENALSNRSRPFSSFNPGYSSFNSGGENVATPAGLTSLNRRCGPYSCRFLSFQGLSMDFQSYSPTQ